MTAVIGRVARSSPGRFIETLLRGVGQVFLQNNPLSGLLVLVGVFLSSYVSGLYAVLGTVVATGTAMLLGVPRASVAQGLYGFNGTLTAIDLTFFVRHDYALPAYVIFACGAVAVLTAALHDFLNSKHVPTLTGAFVLTVWAFLAALRQFGRVAGTPALAPPTLPEGALHGGSPLTAGDALAGFFNGFAEVLLQAGIWTGVAFLLAVAVNSPLSGAVAALGSLIGLAVGWGLGVPEHWLRGGLVGYNAVLTAIALAGVYYVLGPASAVFAAVAAAATVVTYAMFTTVLGPVGLPVVTAPFVVTTWVCLFAASSLRRLRAVHPEDAGTPESNLRSAGRRWQSLTLRATDDPPHETGAGR